MIRKTKGGFVNGKTNYMRLLIISFFISLSCFGQERIAWVDDGPAKPDRAFDVNNGYALDTAKKKMVDTLNVPILSINEVMGFLNSINKKLSAVKELDLPKDQEYNELVKELNRIVGILEKKKKAFK